MINDDELRVIVIDAVVARAMPGKLPAAPTSEETRLSEIGIDSLGLILVSVDLTASTGLQFERSEGMAPIRTVGDVVQFALGLSRQEALK
jgi:acyl carrier protein